MQRFLPGGLHDPCFEQIVHVEGADEFAVFADEQTADAVVLHLAQGFGGETVGGSGVRIGFHDVVHGQQVDTISPIRLQH